jgi:hypothetical protein
LSARVVLSFLWLGFLSCVSLRAHPVAQGSLELRIGGDTATAALRVSNEQIFVAGSLGEGASEAGTFDDLLTQHGRYLLRHFYVLADGTPLTGEVREVQPPTDRSVSGFTTYVLRYAMSRQPAQIEVRQDMLTEILFAPGNPWEAPIVARAWQDERPLTLGALLTAKESLHLTLVSGVAAEFNVPASASAGLAWDFFRQGLLHISAGWDHALFVAALVLALAGFWRVLALISAFTLAHTVTLTVVALGWVHLRSSVVQPLIAASIVAAAALNVFRPAAPLLRSRLAVAFGFGLFHGLGFAGGLVAAMQGFAPSAVAAAIGGFSIGVELGHQVVVLPLLGLLTALRKWAPQYVAPTVYWLGMAILAVGLWLLAVTV